MDVKARLKQMESKRRATEAAKARVAREREYKGIFDLIDKGSGTVSVDNVYEFMNGLGIRVQPDEIDKMFHEYDENSNGDIDFQEFLHIMGQRVDAKYERDDVEEAFRVFPGAGKKSNARDGDLNIDELRTWIRIYSEGKISADEAAEIVSDLPISENGNFNFLDFLDAVFPEDSGPRTLLGDKKSPKKSPRSPKGKKSPRAAS